MIRETTKPTVPGLFALSIFIPTLLLLVGLFILSVANNQPVLVLIFVFLFAATLVLSKGFFVVNPNAAKVLQLFGDYVGTVRAPGLHWANPFFSKRTISVKVRNFESSKLKVNDHDGNPIEIAAVVVWKVVDSAEAAFEVDDYENYVHVQSESAVRNLAAQHAYDAHQERDLSLRGNTNEVAELLKQEIQARLSKAGVEVIEARISHLAYAPEIAQVMLRRQQAAAIIAARQKIVEGAVSMVEMALDMLSKKGIVEFDAERKAQMVSNLMVVLCGEKEVSPILNTGTN